MPGAAGAWGQQADIRPHIRLRPHSVMKLVSCKVRRVLEFSVKRSRYVNDVIYYLM